MNQTAKWLRVAGSLLLLLAFFLGERAVIGISSDQRRRSETKSRVAEQVDDLFRNNCARCHGLDGRGETPLGHTYNAPDFTDTEWWRKNSRFTSTRTLRSIVTRGKASMPAFGKKLKRSEINLLVNRVRSFRARQ
jgi:mono/diheme cytochrome c family protein